MDPVSRWECLHLFSSQLKSLIFKYLPLINIVNKWFHGKRKEKQQQLLVAQLIAGPATEDGHRASGKMERSARPYYLQWHQLATAISMYISPERKPGQTEQTAVKLPQMKWLLSMFLYAPFVESRWGTVWAVPTTERVTPQPRLSVSRTRQVEAARLVGNPWTRVSEKLGSILPLHSDGLATRPATYLYV